MCAGEADSLEILWLSVHEVDDEGKAAIEVVVQNATIFHDRIYNKLEEVPHALADNWLVVDELTEASQAIIGTLRAKVIESRVDGRFKDHFELWVHFGVLARDRLKDAPDRDHEALCSQACLLIEVELVATLGLCLLFVEA